MKINLNFITEASWQDLYGINDEFSFKLIKITNFWRRIRKLLQIMDKFSIFFRSRVKTSAANEPIYTNDAKFELWRSNEPGRPDKPKFRPITGRLSSAKSTSAQPHTAQGRIHGKKISIFGLVSRFIACDSKFRFFTKLKRSILEKN